MALTLEYFVLGILGAGFQTMKGRPDGEVRYRDKQREGRFKIKFLCMSLYPTGGMVRVGQVRVSNLKKRNTVLDSEKSACPGLDGEVEESH